MRLLIADLVTELEPRYENTKRLAEPFRYEGDRPTDIRLTVTDAYLESLMRRAAPNTTEELMENFAFSCDFNRKAIPRFGRRKVHPHAAVAASLRRPRAYPQRRQARRQAERQHRALLRHAL